MTRRPSPGLWLSNCLPRTPPWLALELRRSAGALRRTAALALATLGVEPAAPPPPPSPRPIKTPTGRSYGAHDADHSDGLQGPPDDVLAREMRFVRALCDVAEAMRGVDGSSRPARLRKELEALPRRTPLAHAPFEKAGRLGRVARVPPREGHVFKTKARAPTLVLLETVDDPDADTTCLREEDSESDDDKPVRRMTPAQNHPVRSSVSFVFPSSIHVDGVARDGSTHLTPSTRRDARVSPTTPSPQHTTNAGVRQRAEALAEEPHRTSHLRMMIIRPPPPTWRARSTTTCCRRPRRPKN